MCVKLAVAGRRDVPLFRNCALRLCIVTRKSGRPFQPWLTMRGESFRKCASFLFVPAPTARFCANRGRSPEFATRIFGNADTVGARWRGVSDRQLKFPRMGGASRQLHNAHFRKNHDAHFRKWELPEGHPARFAGPWRLPDDFCAPTTSGSSRSRQRRASKRRLIKLPLVFQGGFRCLQPADAALPSFGGGPPDHTLLAASMISIWSEATWTTSRTADLQPGGPSKGWGGQNRLPWPTIG